MRSRDVNIYTFWIDLDVGNSKFQKYWMVSRGPGTQIQNYDSAPYGGSEPRPAFRHFRTLGSTFGLQNRSQRVKRPQNRGGEGSLTLRILISCVRRAQFAAILVEKSHIFGTKNYRYTCRPISGHFYRFLGAHNCFGRICARPAVAS